MLIGTDNCVNGWGFFWWLVGFLVVFFFFVHMCIRDATYWQLNGVKTVFSRGRSKSMDTLRGSH